MGSDIDQYVDCTVKPSGVASCMVISRTWPKIKDLEKGLYIKGLVDDKYMM